MKNESNLKVGDWTTDGQITAIETENYSERNLWVRNGSVTVDDTYTVWKFGYSQSTKEPTPCLEQEYLDRQNELMEIQKGFYESHPRFQP